MGVSLELKPRELRYLLLLEGVLKRVILLAGVIFVGTLPFLPDIVWKEAALASFLAL